MFRKTVFWIHLVVGIAAGLVILMMSVTGVLLTYERQMLAMAESSHYVPDEDQGTALPLEQLLFIAETEHSDINANSIVIKNDSGAPVELTAGRFGGVALNPYSGEEMEVGSPGMENFFRTVTSIHRWFNASGESRGIARAITGASNLIFLFLILSGLYLWLPSIYKWAMFKTRLFFNAKAVSGKARDFNWHHVFGIWTAIPLTIVVATALVFSYGWANTLVYKIYGEEAPVRRGPPGAGGPGAQMPNAEETVITQNSFLSMDEIFSIAKNEAGEWKQLSLSLPRPDQETVNVTVERGNGAQPHLRHSMTLDRTSGDVISTTGFDAQSPGQRTRSIVRFLHTGEVLGFWGQTIAGLVSLTSILMVWTGFALAWRRLISPIFIKRRLKNS